MSDQQKIQPTHGSVALLDALGTKGRWKKEKASDIINNWNDIISAWETAFSLPESKGLKTKIKAFSDTVIITTTGPNDEVTLLDAGAQVINFVCHAMAKRIFFKGCISIGDFYVSDRIIIGPAIDEAAEYYQLPNWIGVSVTPQAFKIINQDSFQKTQVKEGLPDVFIKYDIPLKNGIENGGYALNINRMYSSIVTGYKFMNKSLPPTLQEMLEEELEKTHDVSASLKIRNTLNFVNYL